VFHFQNIEGLTRSFFVRLREAFPEARILYSAHNYHPRLRQGEPVVPG
jgi:hypothetical protein